MVSPITEVFAKLNSGDRIVFDGTAIVSQIPQSVREQSFLDRPSDVRLLVVTDNLGIRAGFTNHGHPDNEVSLVDFNGENGIMIMPAGTGPYEQIQNAQKVIDAFTGRKVTPDMILAHITPRGAPLRDAVKEIYGPVTGREGVEAQIARFVSAPVITPDGKVEMVPADVTESYAMGLRAPTREELYKLEFQTRLPATIMGDEYKENIEFWDMNNAMKGRDIFLRGENTAFEKLDPLVIVQDEIYLSVDAATGLTKPLKKSVAEATFDVSKATVLRLNDEGRVLSYLRPLERKDMGRSQPKIEPARL